MLSKQGMVGITRCSMVAADVWDRMILEDSGMFYTSRCRLSIFDI